MFNKFKNKKAANKMETNFKKENEEPNEQNGKNENESIENEMQEEANELPFIVSEEEQSTENPIELLQQELALANDKYVRLYSEFDNYKKRSSKERIEWIKSAGSDMIISMLPVLDDFERAIQSFETTEDINAVKEGILLINNKFNTSLTQKGLTPMDAKGKDFDADLHEAITGVPTGDETLKGKVMDEVEKGYFLNDKVIRHAKVVVYN